MKKPAFVLAYAAAAAVPAAAYALALLPSGAARAASGACGAAALALFGGQLWLASRPRAATSALGPRGLAAFHARADAAALALAAVHRVLKIDVLFYPADGLQPALGLAALLAFSAFAVLAALLMANTFLQKAAPLKAFKERAYALLGIDYKKMRAFHAAAAAACATAVAHAFLASSSRTFPAAAALSAFPAVVGGAAYLRYRLAGRKPREGRAPVSGGDAA